jgi:hypothetical protein
MERRRRYVDKGVDEHGEQRRGPLSSIAYVFYPRDIGEWRSGPIEKRTHKPGDPVTIEFTFVPTDRKPAATGLGVVEIDDAGVVVRIIEVNLTNVPGGAPDLKAIMEKAGWKVDLSAGGG